jgi:hypothetical protein
MKERTNPGGFGTPTVTIKVADVVLTAVSRHPAIDLTLSEPHLSFQITSDRADISFHYLGAAIPPYQHTQLIFDSGGSYRIYQEADRYLIPLGLGECTRLAAFDLGFTQGEVYCSFPQDAGGSPSPLTIYLFEHPLDQLALVNYLARAQGALLHSSGLICDDQGWLFVGMSGAGKSTIAKIWQAAGGKILGDDRIVLRRQNGLLHIHGTPWPGELGVASPDSAPLKNIFFLEKSPRNFIRPLPPMEVVTRLVAGSFLPLYNKQGMAAILDFFSQVISDIPCYELGFVPEAGVIDFLREAV